ncbi:MAG: thermonuclease family protein [Moraxellaceae bacterium]|nr:thermonuclease family protein [Moraxellaceae bacterium]
MMLRPVLLAVATSFATGLVYAEPAVCKAVAIADGDTLTALCPGNVRVKVRLAEIDAPEKGQPFGQRSKESLSSICFGKQASVVEEDRDRWGRTIARVHCAGVDANAEQIRAGMAWAFTKYLTDPSIAKLEQRAREQRAGLWVDPRPISPWRVAARRAVEVSGVDSVG